MHLKAKSLAFALAGTAVVVSTAAFFAFRTTGTGTLRSEPADVLVVFGSPADLDGSLLPMGRWRVEEGVAEYRRGRAPYLLFTGGTSANRFVEADVMAGEAVRMGVPPSAIVRETHSTTTVENIRNLRSILQAHGWKRAEMISSADHLPRIAVLLRGVPLQWRLHAAPTPGRSKVELAASYAEEAFAVLVLRTFGTAAEGVLHALAVCEHRILFAFRYVIYSLESLGKP